jgi:5-methylthioribose kinase
MTNKEEFLKQHPEVFFLDAEDLAGLAVYLRKQNWIGESESLTGAGKAGEGNMNYTIRVTTSARTLIVKQARPWVEKYPQIAAPRERAVVEGNFYRQISELSAVAGMMPSLLGFDAISGIIALEDLGEASDFTSLYAGESLPESALDQLADYLTNLHGAFVAATLGEVFSNRAMRELNHQHIFDLPLRQADLLDLDSITDGLRLEAQALKDDKQYVETVTNLGRLYLPNDSNTGGVLLHGDFFPGSWLNTAAGVRVIDPEFCFVGPAEFDLGVMAAHLHLANQPSFLVDRLLARYKASANFDLKLMWQFAGIEIMRRLIGVAQLPLSYGLERKSALLKMSRTLVIN